MKDIQYHLFMNETEMCSSLICYLNSLQQVTFVMTFNGSSDLHGKSTDGNVGYDIPFIIRKSQMDLHMEYKTLNLTKTTDDNGQQTM